MFALRTALLACCLAPAAALAAPIGSGCADGVPLLFNEFAIGMAPPGARYRAEGPTTHVLVRPLALLVPNGDVTARVEFERDGACNLRCPDTLIPLTCPVHGLHPVFIEVRGEGWYKVCMTDDVALGCAG